MRVADQTTNYRRTEYGAPQRTVLSPIPFNDSNGLFTIQSYGDRRIEFADDTIKWDDFMMTVTGIPYKEKLKVIYEIYKTLELQNC